MKVRVDYSSRRTLRARSKRSRCLFEVRVKSVDCVDCVDCVALF